MKLLITGANGQLGQDLVQHARIKSITCIEADLPEYDICRPEGIYALVQDQKPDVLINAAAYTLVDRCETETDLAFAVNGEGPKALARICKEKGIPLIHISTDYVFNGKSDRPYREDDPTSPLSVYGKSKEAGERAIRTIPMHLIVRTSWLYGVHGGNFVKTMLRLGKEKDTLRVVADQYGSPTCAADLAGAVITLAELITRKDQSVPWGTYHYCNQGIISWYDFARAIFEIASRHTRLPLSRVLPIPASEYPTPAVRPAYSALNCKKIEANFGIRQLPWKDSLEWTLHAMLCPDQE